MPAILFHSESWVVGHQAALTPRSFEHGCLRKMIRVPKTTREDKAAYFRRSTHVAKTVYQNLGIQNILDLLGFSSVQKVPEFLQAAIIAKEALSKMLPSFSPANFSFPQGFWRVLDEVQLRILNGLKDEQGGPKATYKKRPDKISLMTLSSTMGSANELCQ